MMPRSTPEYDLSNLFFSFIQAVPQPDSAGLKPCTTQHVAWFGIRSGFCTLKTATGVLRSLWAEIASNKDQYLNRASFDMSKSIFQIKSLHDHVVTVIFIHANGEGTHWKHLLIVIIIILKSLLFC